MSIFRIGDRIVAKKAGTSLGLTIFIVIAFLVVLSAAGALVATVTGERQARDGAAGDLRRIHSGQALLQRKQIRELELANRILTGQSWVADVFADATTLTDDATELRTRVEDFREAQALDLVFFLDVDGRVVFRSGSFREPATGADLSAEPLVAEAKEKKGAAGLWALDGTLELAVITQLVRGFELQGYVGVASSIEPMAEELQRASGVDVLLFADSPTGPAVVSSTLDAGRADTVITALRTEGQGLGRVKRGETVRAVELELWDEPWLAFLTPLRDAGGGTAGATVGLMPVAGRLEVFRQMQLLLAAAAAGALVIAFLVSLLLARRVLGPVNRLAAVTRKLEAGHYDAELPPARGNFAALVAPLRALVRNLRDKQALQSYLEGVSRALPEPARREAASAPVTRELVLVGVEMRRFANPKLGYDPEENVGRFARDLRRIAAAVAGRQGTVEAVSGHRILAVFEGEGNATRALTAATEILLLLTTRENAFDEPVDPVVALTRGAVVSGSVRWGARTDMAVAGLPVQQLESLMREATAGDIFLAKPVAEEIYPALKKAGFEVQAQRGLMSPMPLYRLAADAARQFTGVEPPAVQPRGVAENLKLADVVPGAILGNRFEVLAELGTGPSGAAFKVSDRDRGDFVRIKVLRPEVVADGARVERLKQVLEPARLISHANVLGVLDFGQVDGLAYVSSPFVRGTPLRFFAGKSRAMPLAPAFLLARRIAEGLRAAHHQKLVHGGLKPENVLVEPTGEVRVMDFGHGPQIDPARREAPYPGAPYLAPEQVEGQAAGPRTDVYAWGAVFYELLTGQVPVAGATPAEVGLKRQRGALEPPSRHSPDMPKALETIVLRALEAAPAGRFATVDELVRELDALRA